MITEFDRFDSRPELIIVMITITFYIWMWSMYKMYVFSDIRF